MTIIPEGATPVLDQGYVLLVDCWGSDERIIEAARMSTDKGFLGWGPTQCPGPNCMPVEMLGDHYNPCERRPPCDNGWIPGDEKLLKYLWENKHATPFEMAGLTFEIQAPILVFREWHRHRTQSYSELSARYTALPDMYYIPSTDRLMAGQQSKKNKQSSEAGFTLGQAQIFQGDIENAYRLARKTYDRLLASGVAREIARVVIPVGQYSRMRASANLRNWLAFLTLRMDEAAQWEIRQYANIVGRIIGERFPRTYSLFAA
jgi:thymidylate synthase (FAD)